MNETLEQFLESTVHNYHGEKPKLEQKQTLIDYRNSLMFNGDFTKEDADGTIIYGIVNDYIKVYNREEMQKRFLLNDTGRIVHNVRNHGKMWYVYDSRD